MFTSLGNFGHHAHSMSSFHESRGAPQLKRVSGQGLTVSEQPNLPRDVRSCIKTLDRLIGQMSGHLTHMCTLVSKRHLHKGNGTVVRVVARWWMILVR